MLLNGKLKYLYATLSHENSDFDNVMERKVKVDETEFHMNSD